MTDSSEELVLAAAAASLKDVNVQIPKFKATFKAEIKDILKNLGCNGIFNSGALTGISDEDITVTSIIHQAFIQVDEEGTEAAAATVGTVGITSFTEVPEFKANSPFFYHIVNSTSKLILFSGSVAKPEFK